MLDCTVTGLYLVSLGLRLMVHLHIYVHVYVHLQCTLGNFHLQNISIKTFFVHFISINVARVNIVNTVTAHFGNLITEIILLRMIPELRYMHCTLEFCL